jgi:glycerol uptake facilitator-like aquaporin
VGIQLLINAVATMAGLYGLITIFGPVSGANFNPIVSLVDVLFKDMTATTFGLYCCSQFTGAIVGCILANVMYAVPITISVKERFGYELWISEVIASSTLILVIHGCIRTGEETSVPSAVSLWVGGGYFFTSSSIFANPAVTIGRIFTNTFAGIGPKSAGIYICFQLVGAIVGYGMTRLFYPFKPQPLKKGDNLYRRARVLELQDFYTKGGY